MSARKERELIEKLRMLSMAEIQVFPASVRYVDNDQFTIDVVDSYDVEYYNVRLRASIDGSKSGLIIIPKVDSTVLVGLIGNSDSALYMVMASDVAEIKINCDNIKINDGENGPVLISQEIINDLNEVKQDINALKDVFSNWVTTPNDGGAALKSLATSWANEQLVDTELNDVTNPKLTH